MKNIWTLVIIALFHFGHADATSKVIAHRGHWQVEGACENSRTSLKNALDLDIYGSETDIWMTADGHMMVNHDPSFKNVIIEESTFNQCRELILDNGETMPELDDFLQILKTSVSETKLIIEIKKHNSTERDSAAADLTLQRVAHFGLQDRVEYISFSQAVCKRIIQKSPTAKVSYLNGDLTPSQLRAQGYSGLDYEQHWLRQNGHWIQQAHSEGITVNVWTVDGESEISDMIDRDVDYITTNKPLLAKSIIEKKPHPTTSSPAQQPEPEF